MSKIIKKHNSLPTTFIYLIDVLDIAGTFKKYVFDRLLDADVTFCVVINKLDIVNLKYLNQHLILDEVKKMMIEFISDREESERVKLR
jgi:ribosome biogenesis GTPase A